MRQAPLLLLLSLPLPLPLHLQLLLPPISLITAAVVAAVSDEARSLPRLLRPAAAFAPLPPALPLSLPL